MKKDTVVLLIAALFLLVYIFTGFKPVLIVTLVLSLYETFKKD